jgi:hypothetical protein
MKPRKRSIRWWREKYADGSACIRGIATPWGGIVDVTDCRCSGCLEYVKRYKGTRWLGLALALGLGAAVLVGCGSVSVADADGAAGGPEAAAGAAGVSGSGGAAGAADASGGGRAGTAGAAGAAGASWPSCGSVGYSAVQVRGSCPDSSCKVCEGVKAGAAGPSATPRCVDTSEAGAVFCVVDCSAGCP